METLYMPTILTAEYLKYPQYVVFFLIKTRLWVCWQVEDVIMVEMIDKRTSFCETVIRARYGLRLGMAKKISNRGYLQIKSITSIYRG